MGVKQDYLMRMINDIVRGLALVLTGKKEVRYELPQEQERTEEENLYARILEMADRGEINEAENLLLEELETGDLQMFEMALCFYLHLAHMDEEFLEEHQYTREEIGEGMESLAEDFGVSGLEISMGK